MPARKDTEKKRDNLTTLTVLFPIKLTNKSRFTHRDFHRDVVTVISLQSESEVLTNSTMRYKS